MKFFSLGKPFLVTKMPRGMATKITRADEENPKSKVSPSWRWSFSGARIASVVESMSE